jgi:hypothetical protein
MNLRRRPMKHSNVAQFLDIFSEHPHFILLYGGGRCAELPRGEEHVLSKPHLLVITRERALLQVGSWSSSLFIYSPPSKRLFPKRASPSHLPPRTSRRTPSNLFQTPRPSPSRHHNRSKNEPAISSEDESQPLPMPKAYEISINVSDQWTVLVSCTTFFNRY